MKIDNEDWICPVCGEKRSADLIDYIECVVDGEKKDFDCSEKCPFCEGRAGKDKMAVCSRCGKKACMNCMYIVNPEHKGKHIEQEFVCQDCGVQCNSCKKIVDYTGLTKCELCSSVVCGECGIRVCSKCGKSVCNEHSFICSGCGDVFCTVCMGGSSKDSGEIICSACATVCSVCGKTITVNENRKCEKCGGYLCSDCISECEECGQTVCSKHLVKCRICGKEKCVEHTRVCPSCGEYVCGEHFMECSLCGMEYCASCAGSVKKGCRICSEQKIVKGELEKEMLTLIGEKQPETLKIKKWSYGEGADVFVFKGEGFLWAISVAVEKGSRKILKSKKAGFMRKITGG